VVDRLVRREEIIKLLSTRFSNWKAVNEWYRPYAEQAEQELKEITQYYKQFELDWWVVAKTLPSLASHGDHLSVISYLDKYGLGELVKNLDISIGCVTYNGQLTEISSLDDDELVFGQEEGQTLLFSRKPGSPPISRIASECHWGLVLEKVGQRWRPVAQAFPQYRPLLLFGQSDKRTQKEEDMQKMLKLSNVGIEDLVHPFISIS